MKEKLKSWLYLTWCAVRHFFRRLFTVVTGQYNGLELFHQNYVTEGLIPFDAETEEAVVAALKCVMCGQCSMVKISDALDADIVPAALFRDVSQKRYFGSLAFSKAPECPFGVDFDVFSHFAAEAS